MFNFLHLDQLPFPHRQKSKYPRKVAAHSMSQTFLTSLGRGLQCVISMEGSTPLELQSAACLSEFRMQWQPASISSNLPETPAFPYGLVTWTDLLASLLDLCLSKNERNKQVGFTIPESKGGIVMHLKRGQTLNASLSSSPTMLSPHSSAVVRAAVLGTYQHIVTNPEWLNGFSAHCCSNCFVGVPHS